jgi:N-acetylmuramoyl-L-alanine amidase
MRKGGFVRVLGFLLALFLAALPLRAETLSALARLDAAHSTIGVDGQGLKITLALSQPVPWRVRVKADPPRLVLDFREVDFTGLSSLTVPPGVADLRAGSFRPGWSRLVLELAGPMLVSSAGMQTDGATSVTVQLQPATPAAFAAEAGLPEPPDWALPAVVALPALAKHPGGPVVVVLDPGHGGIDPGAESGDQNEKTIVLAFGLELRDILRRDGFDVVMTRQDDTFVPLETRTSIARAAGADVFLSLHADALPEGDAVGATVYTLAAEATDAASQALAERHDRDDLLAGLDLSQQDDLVAQVLMDMARTETAPRTDRLADALVTAIKAAGLKMHRHPHQEAGFSVLKSPDIPSVLLELGFLSSDRDRTRLTDADWRKSMEGAIVAALQAWAAGEATLQAN